MDTLIQQNGMKLSENNVTTTVHKAIDSASAVISPAMDRMATGAHNAVDKIAGYATQASETVNKKSAQLNSARLQMGETCRNQVRDRPFTTIGIAVASGVLLGWMMKKNNVKNA